MPEPHAPWVPADAGPSPLEPLLSGGLLLALVGLTAWRLRR
jgi:hypothetical protein